MDVVNGLRSRKRDLRSILTKRKPIVEEREKQANGELVEEEPLSPAARLFHEPHFNCYIIAIIGSKIQIKPHIVKDGLEKTLLKHHRFSSIQVLNNKKVGEMKWVKTKVDLESHIYVPNLDPNMDSPDKFVEDYVSDLTKSTIDMSKPLWELHLLNVKTSDAEAIGVFRIHHSLGDGTSLISLLLACTRTTDNPSTLPTVPVKKQKVQKRQSMLLWVLQSTLMALRLFWNTMVDAVMFMATLVFLKDTETPLKGGLGVEFRPKRFVHRTVSLDDIKLIKNSMNMTINDVLLGVTACGLSKYLNRRYDKDGTNRASDMRNNLPNHIRLRATLLINVRPTTGIQALANMMEKDKKNAKLGNWIGYVLLPFNIVLHDNPLDYLREAKATIDRKKLSLEAINTFFSATVILKTIGIKAASAISHNILSKTTMSYSNVVGPLEEIAFYGHPMAYLAPSAYGHPHAFTINFQSYIDKMTIVLAVDEDVVPNPHQLLDDLEKSLKVIKEAIAQRKG